MTTLILVRHGQSEANNMQFFAGNFDADLTELGEKQAKCSAKYIKDNYSVSKVYASDLKRAYKTGKCIADFMGVEIEPNPGLREISAGEWEGQNFDFLRTAYKNDYNIWLTDIGNSRCTGGESARELGKRVLNALEQIAKDNDGKTVVIATHATPIRTMQSYVHTGDYDEMKNIPWVSNASISVLDYDKGNWSFEAVSVDDHLAELKSSLPANV